METKSLAQIEAENKDNLKRNKIIKRIIIAIIIAVFVFLQTPLYDLTVVSIRWGKPMLCGRIANWSPIWEWDLRDNAFSSFIAYPLGGDPEKDGFWVGRENKLIVFPLEIKDKYFWSCMRNELKDEALKIAYESGFEEIEVDLSCVATSPIQVRPRMVKETDSLDKKIKHVESRMYISYYTYVTDDLTEEEMRKRFDYILSRWDTYGEKVPEISVYAYYNKDEYYASERTLKAKIMEIYRSKGNFYDTRIEYLSDDGRIYDEPQ